MPAAVKRNSLLQMCIRDRPGTTGITSADVALADAQVLNTEAQEINVGIERAQFEHAIAVLIGRPPSELTIAHLDLAGGDVYKRQR